MKEEAQSGYYRAIAREFLRRRGAPFLLSPRDLEVIADWEKRHIPLDIVLEGIARAFDGIRDKSRGTRGMPLSFCENQVSRALAQHQDRHAGRRKPAAPRAGKREKARREIQAFLVNLPPEDGDLRALFEAASAVLSKPVPDEDALERIDEDVNEVLCKRAAASKRKESSPGARRRLRGRPDEETGAARTALLKSLRVRRKIPYVSLYYY
jgi:hypothetical protein